jgi:hypothetical protein
MDAQLVMPSTMVWPLVEGDRFSTRSQSARSDMRQCPSSSAAPLTVAAVGDRRERFEADPIHQRPFGRVEIGNADNPRTTLLSSLVGSPFISNVTFASANALRMA